MARERPEMGYFESDGDVSHGIIGLTPGRQITWEEASILCSLKRQNVAPETAQTSEPVTVSAPDPRVDELKADLAAQRTMIAELVSALKEATK